MPAAQTTNRTEYLFLNDEFGWSEKDFVDFLGNSFQGLKNPFSVICFFFHWNSFEFLNFLIFLLRCNIAKCIREENGICCYAVSVSWLRGAGRLDSANPQSLGCRFSITSGPARGPSNDASSLHRQPRWAQHIGVNLNDSDSPHNEQLMIARRIAYL